jgi:hypothetical protein
MDQDPARLPGLDEPARSPTPVLCRLCHRPLTSREARRRGLGEDCRRKLRERLAPAPRRFEVEQDGLFGDGRPS